MQFANPFASPGLWLKGNIHTHTTASDGRMSVREVWAAYRRRGYDFVCLTDHWRRTAAPPGLRGRPILIPAQELNIRIGANASHVVCLGSPRTWPRRPYRSLAGLARAARYRRGTLILAHPYWCGTRSEQLLAARPFLGLEVYNHACELELAKGGARVYWDDLLDAGLRLAGLAADDTHARTHVGGGWIMVKARARTPAAVLAAIRRGCFYSTQGPRLRGLTVRGRLLRVACSAASRIHFMANRNVGGVVTAERDASLTRAAWTAPARARYTRVECVDRDGRTAWSNPVFFK